MKYFKIALSIVWRSWFYLWMLLVIIVLSPFLLVTIGSINTYPSFYKIARIWAKLTFFGMGMSYHIENKHKLEPNKSYMFIANHTSMMDIMMMLILIKDNPFVFVGKAELAKLPIFGFFYKKTCILVDRNDAKSRHKVFESAQERLNKGLSICIFPEGGVPDDTAIVLDKFKDGAFRLAIDHQIPIVPIALGKLKYFFPFSWGKGYPGKVPVYLFEAISTDGKTQNDKKIVKEESYNLIYASVEKWEAEIEK